MCPKPSPGRFLRARRAVAYLLILVFAAIPYIRVQDRPLVLLDVAARRFTLFGHTFLPTDTVLLALLLVGIFLGVFFLTAIFGRVWCGWACPQTVYMEFVFRPIERLFEGAPWRSRKGRTAGTGLGKALKYAAYLLVSLFLAHTFLAYFVGVERLAEWVQRSPVQHPSSFLIVAAVTGAMMFDFSYFREQTCIVACPYGRFQSVMLDRNSLVISYDRGRGEPRGKARRTSAPAPNGTDRSLPVLGNGTPAAAARVGDCVDCRLCVTTCPTGIDIRDGLQMECIHCAQCIDACDAVMAKLNRPKGLIRYSSQAAILGAKTRIVRPRVFIYAAVLLVIGTTLGVLLATQAPANVLVLRGLGAPFTLASETEVSNQIRLKIVNRSDATESFEVSATGAPGMRIALDEIPIVVAPGESRTVPLRVIAPALAFQQGKLEATIRVTSGADFDRTVSYRLIGPGTAPQSSPSTETPRP